MSQNCNWKSKRRIDRKRLGLVGCRYLVLGLVILYCLESIGLLFHDFPDIVRSKGNALFLGFLFIYLVYRISGYFGFYLGLKLFINQVKLENI